MNVLCYIAVDYCLVIDGGNVIITYDRPAINGYWYPVGTEGSFSCHPGYILDAFGGVYCTVGNGDPFWWLFKVPACNGNEINKTNLSFNLQTI